jgi:CRISPR/Cas system CSM-associated protein Csm3 (group 7 of RAMP superfamily)
MKLEVRLNLTIQTALMIGGGEIASGLGIDKATTRQKNGNFSIPASSIKGKLRDECQRILYALNPKQVEFCHPPRAEEMCPQPYINEDTDIETCPICQLFGSPWYPSPLYFSDLIVRTSDMIEGHTIKPGVALDRFSRTAKEQTLYYLETSPQGVDTVFKGLAIHGEVEGHKHAALLYVGIRSLFNIGGSKSVGLGWLADEDKIEAFTLDGEDFTPSETNLAEWNNG